jgi:hypothetical protein
LAGVAAPLTFGAAWNSYTRYLDDVHKGKGLPAAWEAHQKRMGTHIEAAEPRKSLKKNVIYL